MESCLSCEHLVADESIFCDACGCQVRCRSCSQPIKPGCRFCSNCGTSVSPSRAPESPHVADTATSRAINLIHFSKVGRNINLDAKVTDHFGTYLGDAIAHAIGGHTLGRLHSANRARTVEVNADRQPQLNLPFLDSTSEPASSTDHDVAESTSTETDHHHGRHGDESRIRELFIRSGEGEAQLRLDETRLKATGQLDYSQRLTYLFLYAHDLAGRKLVPRLQLTEILEHDAVYDGHVRAWLASSQDLLHENETVALRRSGRERAKAILDEIWNDQIPDKWTPENRGQRKGKSGDNDAQGTDGAPKSGYRGRSKTDIQVEAWANAFKAAYRQLQVFDVLNNRGLVEKGVFALWGIGKATGNIQIVVSRAKIVKFLYSAFGIDAPDGGYFDKVLTGSDAKGKVIKVKGGYKLLQPGIDAAASIAEGSNGTSNTRKWKKGAR